MIRPIIAQSVKWVGKTGGGVIQATDAGLAGTANLMDGSPGDTATGESFAGGTTQGTFWAVIDLGASVYVSRAQAVFSYTGSGINLAIYHTDSPTGTSYTGASVTSGTPIIPGLAARFWLLRVNSSTASGTVTEAASDFRLWDRYGNLILPPGSRVPNGTAITEF